jgi:2-isopropylmalate synthase
MLQKRLGTFEPAFRLESFRVIAEKREDGRVMTEATIKIHASGHRYIATAEGNGPVNALDKALRIAIGRFYPQLAAITLDDYKVRVLEDKKGTDAVTRVLIETKDADSSWGTVGVSENIIEASWEALVDAIEYGLARNPQQESPDPHGK